MSTKESRGLQPQALSYPEITQLYYPQTATLTNPTAPPSSQFLQVAPISGVVTDVFSATLGQLPSATAPQFQPPPPVVGQPQVDAKITTVEQKISRPPSGNIISRMWTWITCAFDASQELASQARKINELQKKVAELEPRALQLQELNAELLRKIDEGKLSFHNLTEDHSKVRSSAESLTQHVIFLTSEKQRLEYQLRLALQDAAIARENLEGQKRLREDQAQGVLDAAVASKQKTIDRLNEELKKNSLIREDLEGKLRQREQTIAELRIQITGLTESIKKYMEGSKQIRSGVDSMARGQELAFEYLAKVIADIKSNAPPPANVPM